MAVISSCDLLRYDDGSVGLLKYADETTGECTSFVSLDDPALMVARSASMAAFILGSCFLPIVVIHNFVRQIPGKNAISIMFGTAIQLCLIVIYGAKENGICEVEGCEWGRGATWHFLSQVLHLVAFGGSLYDSESLWMHQPSRNGNFKVVEKTDTLITSPSGHEKWSTDTCDQCTNKCQIIESAPSTMDHDAVGDFEKSNFDSLVIDQRMP